MRRRGRRGSMEPEEAAVVDVLARYSRSVAAGGAEAWIDLWDDGGIKMPPGAPAVVGKQAIGDGARVRFVGRSARMTIDNKEVQVTGEWAFARGFYTATTTTAGEKRFVDGKYLTIFRRQADGSWKIYRDCYNSNVGVASEGSVDP